MKPYHFNLMIIINKQIIEQQPDGAATESSLKQNELSGISAVINFGLLEIRIQRWDIQKRGDGAMGLDIQHRLLKMGN